MTSLLHQGLHIYPKFLAKFSHKLKVKLQRFYTPCIIYISFDVLFYGWLDLSEVALSFEEEVVGFGVKFKGKISF